MAPGETREIEVRIEPADTYRVRFALLGDSGDASLDQTEVVSDSDGVATVLLTAPSEPTETFTIRASVGTAIAAEAEVTVSSSGNDANLEIVPVYLGQREVGSWTASARPGVTCAELTGTPPEDGPISIGTTATFTPTLSVPAGRDLAVTVRSEFKVAGCLDVPPLTVGEARTVEVPANDVPVQFEGITLELQLDLTHPVPSWEALATATLDQFETAMLGEASNDVGALLDAMTEVGPTHAPDTNLQTVRARGGWDGGLDSHFGEESDIIMRDRLRTWYLAGAPRLDESAPLEATLTPVAEVRDKAYFSPTAFAGFTATEMGFPEDVLVTWRAEPNDKVLMGASFSWLPWLAFTRLAEQEAANAAGLDDPDLLAALLAFVDCEAVAEELHARAVSYMNDCDVTCLADICHDAVELLLDRAHNAVVADAAGLELSVAATVTVDDHARPVELSGQWVGTIDTGDQQAQAEGSAEGWAAAEDSATQEP
jgi:hypothetical protein